MDKATSTGTMLLSAGSIKHRQVTDLDVTDLGFSGPRPQDSVPRGRCSVGTRHAFFSITFVSIYAVSWGGQSSVTRSGFPGPKNPKSSATKTTTWHCSTAIQPKLHWGVLYTARSETWWTFRIFLIVFCLGRGKGESEAKGGGGPIFY